MDWKTLAVGALPALAMLWSLVVAPGASAATRLLVNGTDADAETALAAVRRGLGADYQADVSTPADLLDQGFGSWLVTWPAQLDACPGEPAGLDELSQTLERAEGLMMDLDYGEAQVLLEDLDARLCAATDPLPAAMASRVPFLLGMVLAFRGDDDRARQQFLAAVERQPDLAWDTNFPPDPQQLFLTAATDAVRGVDSTLVLGAAPGGAEAWIDGNPLPIDGEGLPLRGERHLLQLRETDGTVRGAILVVGASGGLSVVSVDDVTEVLDREPRAARAQRAFQALAATALQRGYGEVLLLQSATAATVWHFDEIDHTWSEVSLVLEQQLTRGRRLQAAGSAMLGVGGAIAVVGGVIAGSSAGRGREVVESMTGANGEISAGLYDLHIEEYEGHRRDVTAGWVMLGVGAAVAGVGLPVLIQGTKESRKGAAQASIGGLITPETLVFAVHGRF
jgi:hypothetical protein